MPSASVSALLKTAASPHKSWCAETCCSSGHPPCPAPFQTGIQHQLPQMLSCCCPTACWMRGQMPMVRVKLEVSSHSQPCPGSCRVTQTGRQSCAAGPHSFSGSLLALGQQEGSDACGFFAGRMLEWPLSKCDGVGARAPRPPALCQAPGCSWWAGPHVAGEEMLQRPALPLHCH